MTSTERLSLPSAAKLLHVNLFHLIAEQGLNGLEVTSEHA